MPTDVYAIPASGRSDLQIARVLVVHFSALSVLNKFSLNCLLR
ncbi:hypothetical protein [Xanthomonas sp. 3075]|nr:hypothetical protein [Xanthomonas sp. 3075]MBB4132067.1 hypothetical protein [Xanthomonas sp. 3075]